MAQTKTLRTVQLPTFPESSISTSAQALQSPLEIAQNWLKSFEAALSAGDRASLAGVIHDVAWWRDHLALSWDFHTKEGLPNIIKFLDANLKRSQLYNLKLEENGHFIPCKQSPIEGLDWIESMFYFETAVGFGRGILRLAASSDGTWKAHMIYTALQDLKGHEEASGILRPYGGDNSLKGGAVNGNWYEQRQRKKEFIDEDPAVLVIGAGQAGLTMGAKLQALGVTCLLVEKNKRIGDNWRYRYRTLVTHDPVQYNHMAYLPFPSNWPLFTPKDKIADWFESYASAMELNVWTDTVVKSAEFSDSTRIWTVDIVRSDGSSRQLKPHHVIFCGGQASDPLMPTLPGQEEFEGVLYHASKHEDASVHGDLAGKSVLVVGTGNTAHDIAQNYVEHGASVQMLQRGGTYVLSSKTGLFMLHKGLYDQYGPPTDEADIYAQSLPIPVQFALNVGLTNNIKEAEKDAIDGLSKAGFKLNFGDDGSGIYRMYITRGGGYYIDVGASQLIIDGKIKMVQSPEGIKRLSKKKVILADDRELEADIVVLATGFDNMRMTLRKSLGDKIADRCNDVWDLDEEGEVNAIWRPSGHPKLWFMGGSLALVRAYSKFLALQIKAHEVGLIT